MDVKLYIRGLEMILNRSVILIFGTDYLKIKMTRLWFAYIV